jgi:hypothetical protein
MKVSIAETHEQVEYTVLSREDVSDEILAGMFYTLKDGRYAKGYPREQMMFPHDLALLEKNYNAFLRDELRQENRSLEDMDAALTWLATEFKRRGVRWWLAGSGALYARGLAVKPHDLDVMTYKTEIESIREMVAPYIVEPFHHVTGWVVKGFGVVNYRYRIDFAFEPEDWVDGQGPVDFGPYAQAHLETVLWRGEPILVPPIELHIAPNEARGRHERVKLIREYMEKAGS